MDGDILSTGQAAKLCAVTPDTVLKWIKAGRLRARRTLGGHFRIERRDLLALTAWGGSSDSAPADDPEAAPELGNVVVFSRQGDRQLARAAAAGSPPFRIEIVDSVYRLSAIVESFQPDYVVIDVGLGIDRACEVTQQLRSDPRLHHVQVILATESDEPAPECGAEVFATIESPITLEGIERCLKLRRESDEAPDGPGERS